MASVTYLINGKPHVVENAPAGESLLKIALDAGIPIEHACGGNGYCTTCLCKVQKGAEHLSPRNDREESMGVLEDPDRLGCQAVLEKEGDVAVEVVEL